VAVEVILFVLAVVAVGAASDLARGLIPNWLTVAGAVGGVILHTAQEGLMGFTIGIAGWFVGIALLIGFYACGGMGAGDVKLLGAVGSCLGPSGVMQAAVAIALLGGIYALGVSGRHRGGRATLRSIYAGCLTIALTGCPAPSATSPGPEPLLRYGIVIALGTTLTLWWRGDLSSGS
jgi:prepilin peptidase CpaA